MLTDKIQKEYERWLLNVNEKAKKTLKEMDETSIEDSFYQNLSFGTGGLRGTLGIGTNRMNEYVVAKASQGLANYLGKNSIVVIGYDSRILSDTFARVAATVLSANGIKVYMWPTLTPVPTVSYAVRYYHASAGVMITASHNPSNYNGYKVYGSDGCQITTSDAARILDEINKIDIFTGVQSGDFDSFVNKEIISYIDSSVLSAYINEVKALSVLYGDEIDRTARIVYSPLNGTGLLPVTRVLSEMGFNNLSIVDEQREPDGKFPTCPYPNPEVKEAMELGIEYCKRENADLLLATDPDCDRCGIAVRTEEGEYQLLSGNEVGILLLDYICSQRIKHHKMPPNPVMVKTIVTMDLADSIASHYGVETVNVLTGFKFIGEVIGKLEFQNRKDDYIFGFEESYGYLSGTHVRDKDGVNAVYIICEMFAFYKSKGLSLLDKLNELYDKYGYCLNTLHSYEFHGSSGMIRMQSIMSELRKQKNAIGDEQVVSTEDFLLGLNGLPQSNVLKFHTSKGSVVIRPSGTEPKLKVYISVLAKDIDDARAIERKVVLDLEKILVADNG